MLVLSYSYSTSSSCLPYFFLTLAHSYWMNDLDPVFGDTYTCSTDNYLTHNVFNHEKLFWSSGYPWTADWFSPARR